MLEIYFNTTSREAFDADGNQFRSGMPRLAYMSRDTVRVILCSETPENDNAGVDPATWTRDSSYNVSGIGAMLTVDSDYIHKLKGELAAEVPAGSVSSVTATISSASYAKIPSAGVLRLFDAYGNYEALSYTARSIDGTSVTFTTSGTVSGAYTTGATMDCDQSPYCSAMLDTAASNVEQGEFVFQLVVNSDRLREEMDYTDTEKLSVKGLEILLYKTTDGTDEPLNAFVCDTFSIVGTIGAVGFESDPPDGTENKLAGLVDQLLAAGFEVEQQYDSAGNTQFRFRSVEAGGTWSSWVTVNKGQDGEDGLPCSLTVGTVTTGEPGTDAEVEITGEAPNQTVNFTIPRGNTGESGTAVGSISLFAGATLPEGYLLCDGAALSREVYAELFSAIGTTWGEGDGSTTFNLPDLTDKTVWGGEADAVGGYREAGLPNITGELFQDGVDADTNNGLVWGGNGAFYVGGQQDNNSATYTPSPTQRRPKRMGFDASRSSSIYGHATTVQPPAAVMQFCIKYM